MLSYGMIERKTEEMLGSVGNGLRKVWNPISAGILSVSVNTLLLKSLIRVFVFVVLIYSFLTQVILKESIAKIKGMLYCYLFFAFDFVLFAIDYVVNTKFISVNAKSYLSYRNGISFIIYCFMLILMIYDICNSSNELKDDDSTYLTKVVGAFAFIIMLILMGVLISLQEFIIHNNIEFLNILLATISIIIITFNTKSFKDFAIYMSLTSVVCIILAIVQYLQRHHIITSKDTNIIKYENTNIYSTIISLHKKIKKHLDLFIQNTLDFIEEDEI